MQSRRLFVLLVVVSCIVLTPQGVEADDANAESAALRRQVAKLEAQVKTLQEKLQRAEAKSVAQNTPRSYPDLYQTYSAAYPTSQSGVTRIPSSAVWEVVPSDGGGQDLLDPRIMLRLHDRPRNFLSVTAQMNISTAQKLHAELGRMIQSRLRTHVVR